MFVRDAKRDYGIGRRDHPSTAMRRHEEEKRAHSMLLDSDLQAVRQLSDNPHAAEAHLEVRDTLG